MADDIGTGTTVAFGTSVWAANVISINDIGVSRPSVDTSHLGSTARTAMPGRLLDGESITLEVNHDTAKPPPVSAAAETVTITFYDADTVTFTGFMTSYKVNVGDETINRATAVIQVSGAVTGL